MEEGMKDGRGYEYMEESKEGFNEAMNESDGRSKEGKRKEEGYEGERVGMK